MSDAEDNGGKRKRKASRIQQAINKENDVNALDQIRHQQKKLARQEKKLLKQRQQEQAADKDELGPESQSEDDEGFGKVIGGGFTSAVSSRGVVLSLGGAKPPPRRRLVREDYAQSDPIDSITPREPPHDAGVNSSREVQSSPPPTQQPRRHQNSNLLDFDDEPEDHNDGIMDALSHQPTAPSTASQHPPTPSAASRPEHSEPSHPAKRIKLPPAPFRDGKTPGKNAKAADYEEGVEKMLLNAMHEFSCLVLATDAFPDDETQINWARTVWRNACRKVDSHYELSHRMMKLITERDSWARGILKDAGREHFKEYFKFKKGSAEDTKKYNKELRLTLLEDDAFHHKDPKAGTGFAESPIIADMLETALFEDSADYGVRFSSYFKPIPLNLLALVITIIEFLIDEYASGEQVKATFREKTNRDRFEKHTRRVQEWSGLNERVTTNIRMKLFTKLVKRAGGSRGPVQTISGMTMGMREKAQQALDLRTGETDSEAE